MKHPQRKQFSAFLASSIAVVVLMAVVALPSGAANSPLEIVAMPAAAAPVTQNSINERISVDQNFAKTGHTLMRRFDGSLNAIVVEGAEGERMRYLMSTDDGRSWKGLNIDTVGASPQPALDSNEYAAYISYVSNGPNGAAGHVVRIQDPFGKAVVKDSGPLTPAGKSQYSSVAASRLGVKSVAYGWFDPATGAISVGVSRDGVTFPAAKVVATDKYARYGPSVGIFGKAVIVTYETANPAFAPAGAAAGGYGAYLESYDGGATWSKPRPLFDAKSLPSVKVSGQADVRLAGLQTSDSKGANLMWWVATVGESRVFITSPMTYRDPADGSLKTVAVVSSKLPVKGGAWTHTIVADDAKPARAIANGAFHQYSALPGTPLRVVSYIERDGKGEESLVAQISTNNAKSFSREVRFKVSDIGLTGKSPAVLRSSLCLWRDGDGAVSLDTFVASAAGGTADGIVHARLPLGIRLKGGEVITASNW